MEDVLSCMKEESGNGQNSVVRRKIIEIYKQYLDNQEVILGLLSIWLIRETLKISQNFSWKN